MESLGPNDTVDTVRRKFAYVRTNWYWPVIEQLFFEAVELTARQNAAINELAGK